VGAKATWLGTTRRVFKRRLRGGCEPWQYGEKLCARSSVVREGSGGGNGHNFGAVLALSTCGETGGGQSRDTPSTARTKDCHERIGDLLGQSLLQHEALTEALNQPRDTTEAYDAPGWRVTHVNHARRRQQVMRAHHHCLDGCDYHERGAGMGNALAENRVGIECVAGKQIVGESFCDAFTRSLQLWVAGTIDAESIKEFVNAAGGAHQIGRLGTKRGHRVRSLERVWPLASCR